MKIQELAIIFIIIILPISILLSEYTQFQIQTVKMQTSYDAKLTAATYDAIKAFQLNTINSTESGMANPKMRDLTASVNSFKNSIISTFKLNGYTQEELNNYIPALVYTLYDGFYIYSPYNNQNHQYDEETGEATAGNGENIYGLKPYISYSCRYIKSGIDVVIAYSLDNYITVQGKIGDKYVSESGYLIDNIVVDGGHVIYNGVEIETESLKENFMGEIRPYARINGTKYYLVEDHLEGKDCIVYLLNGTPIIQYEEGEVEFSKWKNLILNNDKAKQYYSEAYKFTKWLKEETNLHSLTYADAYDEKIDKNTGEAEIDKIWPENTSEIFDFNVQNGDVNNNIENELSNFNQHRLAVIRHKIETNLAIAISNYNTYSKVTSNVFQMPELKENEWEHITHNIALISFLQGLSIGGKNYNGYSIVTNSESKEVVLENNIYILGNDKNYHRIGDKGFENNIVSVDESAHMESKSAGRLNLDFKKTKINYSDVSTSYYYPLNEYNASYDSIVMQNNVTTYEDIYQYINEQSAKLKEAFYTALGRERKSRYNSNEIIKNSGPYLPPGYTIEPDTDLSNGLVIKDSSGNEFVWIEVPHSSIIYKTAGLNITSFTDEEYTKIENDLKAYTTGYSATVSAEDTWAAYERNGLTETQYNQQKKKMLKSIYQNGGFYIGRYETGSTTARTSENAATRTTAVIKQNAYPYNYVSSINAQSISSDFASNGYTSSLMFGIQWDLVLKYLETKGTPSNKLRGIDASLDWGNYMNYQHEIKTEAEYLVDGTWVSVQDGGNIKPAGSRRLLTTGASEAFCKQNIYDLAGNLYEITLEKYLAGGNNGSIVERGNYFGESEVQYSAAVRGATSTTHSAGISRGFRVALYKDEGI